MLRKTNCFTCLFLFLVLLFLPLSAFALIDNNFLGTIRIISEKPSVQIRGNEERFTVDESGAIPRENDEIITGEKGRACILFTLLSEENEIFLAPNTRITINELIINSELTEYHIRLISGKLRARIRITQGIRVRVNTDIVEIFTDEGEFIVENRRNLTTVGAISGLLNLTQINANRRVKVVEQTMVVFDPHTPAYHPTSLSREFFHGVEVKERSGRTVGLVKRQERLERERRERLEKYRKQESERKAADKKNSRRASTLRRRLPPSRSVARKVRSLTPKSRRRMKPPTRKPVQKKPPTLNQSPPQKERTAEEKAEQQGLFSTYKWDMAAGSVFLVSVWFALDEAKKYNALVSQNDDIKSDYATATTSEKTQLNIDYEVNQEKMAQHKTTMERYNVISYAAVLWECYLLYSRLFTETSGDPKKESAGLEEWSTQLALLTNQRGATPTLKMTATWKW